MTDETTAQHAYEWKRTQALAARVIALEAEQGKAEADWIAIAAQNAKDANARLAAAEATITRLLEALQVIADCPDTAVHLMPLAAQAALAASSEAEP